jgi:hypothetical protein
MISALPDAHLILILRADVRLWAGSRLKTARTVETRYAMRPRGLRTAALSTDSMCPAHSIGASPSIESRALQ